MSWRDLLLTRMSSVADFGKVYSYERYDNTNNLQKLKALYMHDDKVQGGFLSLSRGHQETDGGIQGKQRNIELTLFSSWIDSDASQVEFDDKIELLLEDSANDARLSGQWMFKHQNGTLGWQLTSNQPAMFAGVLVHMAKLSTTLYTLN